MSDSFTGLTHIATCDLGGVCRGRAVPNSDSERWDREGTGWVPASIAMSPLGHIVEGNSFAAIGDLRLIPDPTTRCELPSIRNKPAVSLVLGDLVTTGGGEWHCSSRTFLRRAVSELADSTGLTLLAAFEHEFTLVDEEAPSSPLSLQSLRHVEPFGSDLVRCLALAGLQPEAWHPEYGSHQWEITVAPTDAAAAADRAILLREIVRFVADAHERHVTFAPVPDDGPVGNGVHVHLSLRNADGSSATFDPAAPGRLSALAESFAAGILEHASAITAITAPSPLSALRLRPGRWSAASADVGYQDRESMLRICPALDLPGSSPIDHLNIEYRAADATANPWLVMGVLIKAGLEGIRRELRINDPTRVAPPTDSSERSRSLALPASLRESLVALESDDIVLGWFPPELIATYLLVKQNEELETAGTSIEDLRLLYSRLY